MHTEIRKYLDVCTFLSIRRFPDAMKRSNSLQIWAAEIDKYHAVVASHEAEVRQIQAEGKPGFQGQRAWDNLEKDRFFTIITITNWHDKRQTWCFRSPNQLKR